MRYLLDTNAVIALRTHSQSLVANRIRRQNVQDVGVSAIVLHELYFGAFRSQWPQRGIHLLDAMQFAIVDFGRDDARHAGEIRAILASRGTPIGPVDVLIAGQARARQLILVTHNTREFARVPYLRIEDWTRARGHR
jgi:tRNA(fMet)-specific endonuclease VapC